MRNPMLLFRRSTDQTVTSVLFYSNGDATGDAAIQLVMLQALRKALPDARFTWLSEGNTVYASSLRSLTEGLLDDVWTLNATLPGQPRADAALFKTRFDVVLDLRHFLKRTLWLKRRIKHGVFISPAMRFFLSDRRPPQGRKNPPLLAERLMRWASLVAGYPLTPERLTLRDARLPEAARALLPEGGDYVGFLPGASSDYKRWPLDRFVAVARGVEDRGYRPVFFIGPGEPELEAPLRSAFPDAFFPLSEKVASDLGAGLTVALAARLRACVANDGGGAHLSALAVPSMVCLFRGRFVAKKYTPTLPRTIALAPEDYGVTATDFKGHVDAIPVSGVEAALTALLNETQ